MVLIANDIGKGSHLMKLFLAILEGKLSLGNDPVSQFVRHWILVGAANA